MLVDIVQNDHRFYFQFIVPKGPWFKGERKKQFESWVKQIELARHNPKYVAIMMIEFIRAAEKLEKEYRERSENEN